MVGIKVEGAWEEWWKGEQRPKVWRLEWVKVSSYEGMGLYRWKKMVRRMEHGTKGCEWDGGLNGQNPKNSGEGPISRKHYEIMATGLIKQHGFDTMYMNRKKFLTLVIFLKFPQETSSPHSEKG